MTERKKTFPFNDRSRRFYVDEVKWGPKSTYVATEKDKAGDNYADTVAASLALKAAMAGDVAQLKLSFKSHTNEIWTARFGESGMPPLHLAAERGHLEAVSFILESCPVDLRAHGAAWSALDCAADAGQAEACELLISKGAKIGSTCLARCVLHRNLNLLEQLLYHLPEFKDGSGLERKSDAKEQQKASSSSASEAKLPLRMKRQTDPTKARNSPLNGLLHTALQEGYHAPTIQFLLDRGFDPEELCQGQRCLHLAVRDSERLPLAKQLLESGLVSVESLTSAGNTPLHEAAMRGNLPAMNLLLQYGAKIDGLTRRKQNGLHLAAERGHSHVVKFLLEKGIPVDAVDADGRSALFLAAGLDATEVCELLVESKADLNMRCTQDRLSPVQIAAQNGRIESTRFLLSKGADHQHDPEWKKYLTKAGVPSQFANLSALALAAQTYQHECIAMMVCWGVPVDSTMQPFNSGTIGNSIERGNKQRLLKLAVEKLAGLDLLPWRLWGIVIQYYA